ncbi:TPA: hypothetical protein KQG29_001517 [Clostridioides difficile]|nr:hypothetical protein [Clostridioides difficile]
MIYKVFKNNYNRKEFYSLVGKYFAEKKYKSKLEYLSNEDNYIWIIAIENNEAHGFTVFEEKKNLIIFDYTYSEIAAIEKELLKRRFYLIKDINKAIKVELLKKDCDIKYWLEKGFIITRESKNYIFLRREARKSDR